MPRRFRPPGNDNAAKLVAAEQDHGDDCEQQEREQPPRPPPVQPCRGNAPHGRRTFPVLRAAGGILFFFPGVSGVGVRCRKGVHRRFAGILPPFMAARAAPHRAAGRSQGRRIDQEPRRTIRAAEYHCRGFGSPLLSIPVDRIAPPLIGVVAAPVTWVSGDGMEGGLCRSRTGGSSAKPPAGAVPRPGRRANGPGD